jgi:hypothetical protein
MVCSCIAWPVLCLRTAQGAWKSVRRGWNAGDLLRSLAPYSLEEIIPRLANVGNRRKNLAEKS